LQNKTHSLRAFCSILFNLMRFSMAFQYVGSEAQGDVTGKLKLFVSNSSGVLGPGDAVLITGTATTAGVPTVDVATANSAFTGVIASVSPVFAGEALSQTWVAASGTNNLLVNVDPFALYEADVANGPLAVTDVGLNVPLVATVGTVSGSLFTSNMTVNATGAAITATLPFRVVRLLEDSAGVLGNRALVRANATTSNIGATGI
jgi:hypothetical protein